MMKIYHALLILTVIFSACQKNDALTEDDNQQENPPAQEEVANSKKGLCLTTTRTDWSHRVSEVKVYWHYSWGNILSEYEPDSVDFVPMIWGSGRIDDATINELKVLKAEGKIKYLLGFNEPNKTDQSNITVEEAVAFWPQLMEVGVPLGSPAVAGTTVDNPWLKQFMTQVKQNNLRVDFITVHQYSIDNVPNFIQSLKDLYNKYKLPLWITEFAVADWSATTAQENKYSQEFVLNFMKNLLPELEKLDFVHRYSWFGPPGWDKPALVTSALWDVDGHLTPLGEFYASFKPNEKIGEGKATIVPIDPVNGFEDNFENYVPGTGLGRLEYVIWGGSALVLAGDAYEGKQFGQSDMNKQNFAIRKTFLLEAGKTYKLEIATKMEDGLKHVIQVHPKEVYGAAWKDCFNIDWENHVTQFIVTKGNEEVTIALYRWQQKLLNFDVIRLTEVR